MSSCSPSIVNNATRLIAAGIDAASAMGHLTLRQRMPHEHCIYRLQIKFRGEIHDREIFVVEFFVLLRRIPVAAHQIEEQLLVRLDVPLEVHADEAVELKESGIDIAHEARIGKRHLGNDMAAEPIDAAPFGERVHRGRVDPGVDRSPHENHGDWHAGILVGFHQRHCGENRH